MPRMTDMDIDFVSLVNKGANKQKVHIYKADESEEATEPIEKQETQQEPANEEMSGFFNAVKKFFTGVEKADKKTLSFSDRLLETDLTEGMWRINDALRSTMRDIIRDDNVKDKKVALKQAIDDFATYMKKKVDDATKITKEDANFYAEPIEKAGAKISAAKLKQINDAIASLNAIVEDAKPKSNEGEGGSEVMKAEDIAKALKEAVEPISKSVEDLSKRIDSIEKGEVAEVVKEEPSDLAGDIAKALKEALEPVTKAVGDLTERVATVEKAKGIKKSGDAGSEEGTKVEKSIFAGVL